MIYKFNIEKFESENNECENCNHFEYDCHLNGDLYYFCSLLELPQTECKPCLFHEKYEFVNFQL